MKKWLSKYLVLVSMLVMVLVVVSCAPREGAIAGEAVKIKPGTTATPQLVVVDKKELLTKSYDLFNSEALFEKSGAEACKLMGYSGCEAALISSVYLEYSSFDGSCLSEKKLFIDTETELTGCNVILDKDKCVASSPAIKDIRVGSQLTGVFCTK